MSAAISPLAPKSYATMPPVEGVRIATAEAGIKYKNRTDLLVMAFDQGTEVAGVFTRSKCPSAPVDLLPRQPGGRQSAGAGRQFRQCQRLHRQAWARIDRLTAEAAGKAARLQERRGLPRLDRRHRRAA